MAQDPTSDRKDKIGSPNTPEGFVEGSGISLEDVKEGYALEAASFDGKWYFGKIVFVDDSDQTFLVHFDGWNVRFDEWYRFSSKKVRPLPHCLDIGRRKGPMFRPGEHVLARWVDDKYYRCHIVKAKSGEKYEVRFEDGVLTTVEANKIRKANKVDEYSESVRLVKQQETIERAKSRDQRLKRRSQHNQSDPSTPLDSNSSSVFVSELVELEEGLDLSVSLPLSALYLRSLEVDEASPDLTVLQGKTFSVKSPSFVVRGGPPVTAVAESDTSLSPPHSPVPWDNDQPPSPSPSPPSPSPSPPSPSPSTVVISTCHDVMTGETFSTSLNNLDTSEPPSVQAPPPLLPTPLPAYTAPLPYTETVMTADGRMLTLTPSFQQSPVPPPNPAPSAEPLYYQLVPIQVSPPGNPANLSIQPVDQSYLTIQQPYSYPVPIQTQYTPLVQQIPSYSLPDNMQQMPTVNLTENLQQVTAYTLPDNLHQIAPPSSAYSIPESLQIPSIQLQHSLEHSAVAISSQSILTQPQLVPLAPPPTSNPTTSSTVQPESHSECHVISDSESDCDRALFIDVSSAPEPSKPDYVEVSSTRESKSSVSEEESDSRELKKLRLPDHNRKVAPRELVTTLESEPHLCERPGCAKQFRRKESLKKHLRLYHGEGGGRVSGSKQQAMSPLARLDVEAPQFPTNADHSITQTELLFPTTPPPLVHRSKRKSSQPKKSSFHEPTTPTVTILVPSDLETGRPDPQPTPISSLPPSKPTTSNPAPSRQSKRIRIRKNWDYNGEYVTNKKSDKSTKIKSTSISEKSGKHEKVLLSKKALGSNTKAKLTQELKERAIIKIRPPKEQIITTTESIKAVEPSVPSEEREIPVPEVPVSKEVPIAPVVEVESDQEVVQLVEEMEVVDPQVSIIDLDPMETSVVEPTAETDTVLDLGTTEHVAKEIDASTPENIPDIPERREKEKSESITSSSDEESESSNAQEQIECVCGLRKDEGVMVQCEQCMTWQHTSCMGLSDRDLPDQHTCHSCSDPPALIKREEYKHSNPWFKSGKLLYPTDADLVETSAQLSYLKNQLKSIQSLIPGLNLKINIAKNGNHPFLKEFKSKLYQMLTPEEIKEKVAQLSELQTSEAVEMDISFKESEVFEKESRHLQTIQSKVSGMEDEQSIPLESQKISESVGQPIEGPSKNLTPEETSNKNGNSIPLGEQIEESVRPLQITAPIISDMNAITEENLNPDLSDLMTALNGTDWGCQMRLFHSIEQIQNSLMTQFSSIENCLTSLQFRIPDVDSKSLNDTLLQLDSFLEPIANK